MASHFNRRRFISLAGAATGAAALEGCCLTLHEDESAAAPPRNRRRTLRIAHLTDTHVTPDKPAAQGLAADQQHSAEQAQ